MHDIDSIKKRCDIDSGYEGPYSEQKVQLHKHKDDETITYIYPKTKGDIVYLEDEEFFDDVVLENNIKNLYNYKIDTVKFQQLDEGTLLTFFAQGVAVDIRDENDVVRSNILIPGRRANGEIYVVRSLIERDSIEDRKKTLGMLCYVIETKKTYQLINVEENTWKSLSGSGVGYVQTIAERDEIKDSDRELGMLCYVVSENMTYQLLGGTSNDNWIKFKASSYHIGSDEPTDTDLLWVDTTDEDVEETVSQGDVYSHIQEKIGELNSKITNVNSILNFGLDPGYFLDKDPDYPEGEAPEDEFDNYYGNKWTGNVDSILIKRGLRADLNKEKIREGELYYCTDRKELYVGGKGVVELLAKGGSGGSGGGGNVSGEYVILESPDRSLYRIHMDDSGQIHVTPNLAYTAGDANIGNISLYKNLKINHVFGGGRTGAGVSPVSHSFIEIYNDSNNPINLKGLSLQVGSTGTPWKVKQLFGILQPRHSFLVRCSMVSNKYIHTTRLNIVDYDMDWDQEISSSGFKVYLCVGKDACEYANPANTNGLGAVAENYIDLIGVGGSIVGQTIDGYEGAFLQVANTHTSVHRIDFKKRTLANGGGNFTDWEPINWKTADPYIYFPRCTKHGEWDIHYDKIKLSSHRPMLINVGFGANGFTDRTFTWQTQRTQFGYLKYRKVGESHYRTVESKRFVVTHGDGDATVHSVIIKNLDPGLYEYYVGEEGRWSDVYTFLVKQPNLSNGDEIKILHVTDQQGFCELDYLSWKEACKKIQEWETYDFIINTGDISNSANRSFEWRYYYEFGKDNLYNYEHMTTCGNNDLIEKKYPDAFRWYSTYENELVIQDNDGNTKEFPSVYSWNYGDIHFVSLNSNIDVFSDPADEIKEPTPIEPQLEWLEQDLSKPENKKRWTIVYMHEAPYTIIRNDKLIAFHDIFAKYNVDLVLCGHHHMYSRSHAMGPRTANGDNTIVSRGEPYQVSQNPDANVELPEQPIGPRTFSNGGVVYVMGQATGSKLVGKTPIPSDASAPWRGHLYRAAQPSYNTLKITNNELRLDSYFITNIHPIENLGVNPIKRFKIDDILIRKN